MNINNSAIILYRSTEDFIKRFAPKKLTDSVEILDDIDDESCRYNILWHYRVDSSLYIFTRNDYYHSLQNDYTYANGFYEPHT